LPVQVVKLDRGLAMGVDAGWRKVTYSGGPSR
jgi:hypothetical protein